MCPALHFLPPSLTALLWLIMAISNVPAVLGLILATFIFSTCHIREKRILTVVSFSSCVNRSQIIATEVCGCVSSHGKHMKEQPSRAAMNNVYVLLGTKVIVCDYLL